MPSHFLITIQCNYYTKIQKLNIRFSLQITCKNTNAMHAHIICSLHILFHSGTLVSHTETCVGHFSARKRQTQPMFAQTGSESGTAETGGSLSHSTSSLDRDEPLHEQQVTYFSPFNVYIIKKQGVQLNYGLTAIYIIVVGLQNCSKVATKIIL